MNDTSEPSSRSSLPSSGTSRSSKKDRSRLDHLAGGRSKRRKAESTYVQDTLSRSFSGTTTVSQFIPDYAGSRTILREKKIEIPAPLLAPPVVTLPPLDCRWDWEEVVVPPTLHGGVKYIAKDVSSKATESRQNSVRLASCTSIPCYD
jgi:hypothetical protein